MKLDRSNFEIQKKLLIYTKDNTLMLIIIRKS